MVIWISGPYGVGKSTLAEYMQSKMKDTLIFDAEAVGNAVRDNYPDHPYGFIFEDYELWGDFCYKLIKDIHENFHKNVIVPMTLLRQNSYRIIENLRKDGIDTHLVVLEADHQTVHDRILDRGEKEGCWCMENIDLSREGTAALPGIHVATDDKTVEELYEVIGCKIGTTIADIDFIRPSFEYAKEIGDYRQEFFDCGDHMDGCGPLRKYEDPKEYIEICKQKSNPDTAEAAGGQAEQFLLVRKSDNRLVGMAQYRFGVDPKFCIGYSVRPSERRKGYAKMALQNLLQWLKDQGQVSTPIACEPSNEASKKVILSCGGKLTDTCTYKGIDLMVFEIPIE